MLLTFVSGGVSDGLSQTLRSQDTRNEAQALIIDQWGMCAAKLHPLRVTTCVCGATGHRCCPFTQTDL